MECKNCGHDFYKKKGDKNEFCTSECEFSYQFEIAKLKRERKREKEEKKIK